MPDRDRLDDMMARQLLLQTASYNSDPRRLMPEERAEFIRWNTLACIAELVEALDESGWKPWATSRHLNREEFLGEIVDAWHFMMNLLLTADVTPEEFHAAYLVKADRNAARQLEGYDGVETKCPSCKRELDKPDAVRGGLDHGYECTACGAALTTDVGMKALMIAARTR